MVRGDQAKVEVLVRVSPAEAFRIFTEEIDGWWRSGLKYRIAGGPRSRGGESGRSVIHLEPKLGGRLLESAGETIHEKGVVTSWDPPRRVVFEWRAVNFAPGEKTEVEVLFDETRSGTNVTVIHRGWARIREDHPVRHGQEPSAFTRTMGMWWGDLVTAFRMRAEAS